MIDDKIEALTLNYVEYTTFGMVNFANKISLNNKFYAFNIESGMRNEERSNIVRVQQQCECH